jgi:hypothetical protein
MVGAAVCVAACGGSTEPVTAKYVGDYSLTSVAGTPLPAALAGVVVSSSTLTLHGNGTFERTLADSPFPLHGSETPTDLGPLAGTWQVYRGGDGALLGLNGVIVGPLTEDRAEISFIHPGLDPWIYVRQ